MTGSRCFGVLLILAVVMTLVPRGIATEPELKSPMNLDETLDFSIYGVTQQEASLLYLWQNFKNSSGSERATKEIQDMFTYRGLVDKSVDMIGFLLFGPQYGRLIRDSVREPGQPIHWECYKPMVGLFEKHCGEITDYALSRLGSFARMCSHLVQDAAVEEAFKIACSTKIDIPDVLQT